MTDQTTGTSYARRRFQHVIDGFAATKATYVIRLQADPIDALKWADRFAEAAAEANVATQIVTLIDSGVALADIITETRRTVIDRARSSTTSTSAFSNATDQKLLNELARALSKLESCAE